jgi:predicted lipoprotein with Yx(FWY)xxD motif
MHAARMGSTRRRRRLRATLALVAAVVLGALASTLSGALAAGSDGIVVATGPGPFGPELVAGSGPYAGEILYLVTSDAPPAYGCTTALVALPEGAVSCTGPSNDRHAEWPALTTSGAPVAGPNVSRRLLGAVQRPGIGDQVTYAGHPLYIFDSTQLSGEDIFEPSLPPDHGVWYAVTPAGQPRAWPGMLASETLAGGRRVLAAAVIDGGGWQLAPVYAYSRDGGGHSACVSACAVAWPPLLTSGTPGAQGLAQPGALGTLARADGTLQVTYQRHPLYLYGDERVVKDPNDASYRFTGSGNDVSFPGGGTFHLVTP